MVDHRSNFQALQHPQGEQQGHPVMPLLFGHGRQALLIIVVRHDESYWRFS
jgi:hypothetical protein